MVAIDVAQWLEQWVELNLHAKEHVEKKAQMHDLAKACAKEAKEAGISIVELKEAAEGDLETFLVRRQNTAFDRQGTVSGSANVAARAAGSDEIIPIYEERLDIGRREVSHGRVTVHSHVVETSVDERVSLRTESVQVEVAPIVCTG